MTMMREVARNAGTRLLENWPQKLGALLLAALLWFFVSTNADSTTQRSLLVPLSVEGVGERRVAVGLPDFVEVTVAGPSNRVDRLRPENIEAVLDLSGLQGEFQQTIDVRPPQGIDLLRVNPEEVIGFIESVSSKQVTVEVALVGDPPEDVVATSEVDPETVSVSARTEILERVVRAVAPAPPAEGETEVRIFATGADGLPIRDVTLTPATVAVRTRWQPYLIEKEIEVQLEEPASDLLADASLSSGTVSVAGPPSALRDLDSVTARVDPATADRAPGRYTLPVQLDLPSAVVAVDPPDVSVTVRRTPLQE